MNSSSSLKDNDPSIDRRVDPPDPPAAHHGPWDCVNSAE